MNMYKVIFYGAVAFISAVAIFLGLVVILTSLQNGSIMLAYKVGGQAIDETVTRAADAGRFWRLLAAMGLAPALLGAAAMWFSVHKLRAQ